MWNDQSARECVARAGTKGVQRGRTRPPAHQSLTWMSANSDAGMVSHASMRSPVGEYLSAVLLRSVHSRWIVATGQVPLALGAPLTAPACLGSGICHRVLGKISKQGTLGNTRPDEAEWMSMQ